MAQGNGCGVSALFVAFGARIGRISKKEGLAIIALASSIASPHYHEEASSWRL